MKTEIVTCDERSSLFNRINTVNVFINNNYISREAIEINMYLEKNDIKKFFDILYSYDIPEDRKKFNNLESIVRTMEKMAEIAEQDLNICQNVVNRGYSEIEKTEFISILKKVAAEFPKETQDTIIKCAKDKLSMEYDRIERAFSNKFIDFVNEYFPCREVNGILLGHEYLQCIRTIDRLEVQRDLYSEYLTRGIYTVSLDDEDNEYEETEILSEEKAAYYRKLLDDTLDQTETTREYLKSINVSHKDIEAAQNAERYYLLFRGRYSLGYFAEDRELQIISLRRQKLQKNNIRDKPLTVKQQKALLAIYLDKCFDDKGYLLPEHFGTGIYLIRLNAAYSFLPYDWVAQKDKYEIGYTIPKADPGSPLYKLINEHPNVFIKARYMTMIKAAHQVLSDVSDDILSAVFHKLKKLFYFEKVYSENADEYYRTLAEYSDLVAMTESIGKSGNYSREEIYRVVYEMCKKHSCEREFSPDIILYIENAIMYDRLDWLWEMHLFSYCTRYKRVDRLISYISKIILKEKEQAAENKEFE